MSEKLRVAELREELAKRGLDTTGLKAALVARLDDAISSGTKTDTAADGKPDEKADETAGGSDNVTQSKAGRGKRARDKVDNDKFSESNVKRLKVEEINELTVNELREALTALDCPTEGTKKILRNRLLEAVNGDSLPDGDKTNDADAKVVTAIKRGRGVLDPHIPDHMKATSEVLWDSASDDVYVAMLNQTNIGGNNNKFYVIQALQDSSNSFFVFTRWGRVGAVGQSDLARCNSKMDAITQFEQKFQSKTSNAWSDRHDFQPRKGKYTWLEMDYGSDDEQQKGDKPPPVERKIVESDKLDPLVRTLLKTISDREMMSSLMSEIGYDTNKLPLGKLGKSTISKGYEVLKRLSAALEAKKKLTELQELTSEFYTVIPHDFGRRGMSFFTIDTPAKLKRKLEMVEALGEIELATKILQAGESETEEDPVLRQYEEMNCEIEPLDMTSDEADWIQAYTMNSHSGKTHGHFSLEVKQIYKINRQAESDRFKPFSKVKHRMLLWHGSRLCNWIGILSQGLRIAPPEAPVNGYMFGKGVYFADMVSKSAGYCCASGMNPTALLLLSEVALGEMRELNQCDYNANQLPPGKLSTKGVGSHYPNPKGNKVLSDGVIVPLGKPVQDTGSGRCLAHHEYIVYNEAQIRMKYLLMVKFKYP